MKIISYCILLLSVTLLSACSSPREEGCDNLAEVEQALDRADFDRAQRLLNDHFSGDALQDLSAEQYGRLSIIYMRLADVTDSPDNWQSTPIAADLYGRAFKADSVMAEKFYAALPTEYNGFVNVMRNVYFVHK